MRANRWVGVLAAGLLAGCGGGDGGSPTTPSRNNGSPTLSATANDPNPLMGATSVTFTATGTDPDGDGISYAWNFGDGTTGTGQTAAHVFPTVGTFSVTATASDGKGGSGTATVAVTARSVSGTWTSQARAWNFEFQQVGGQITGSLLGYKNVTYNPAFPLTGVVKDSRRVEFDVAGILSFVGTANPGATQLTGTLMEGNRNYGEVLEKR